PPRPSPARATGSGCSSPSALRGPLGLWGAQRCSSPIGACRRRIGGRSAGEVTTRAARSFPSPPLLFLPRPRNGGEGRGEGVPVTERADRTPCVLDRPPHPNPLPRSGGEGTKREWGEGKERNGERFFGIPLLLRTLHQERLSARRLLT